MADEPSRRAVLRRALSVGIATSTYGVSFGALAVANGLSVWQACVSSLLLFSGGSQFALAGVLGAGGSVGAAVASSSLLGVRNGVYAVQLAALLRPRGWKRFAAAQLTIDESTAVAVSQDSPEGRSLGFWATGLTVYVGWNLMTLVGALAGSHLGDPRRYGLDAAAAAAFLALLWPRLRARQPVAVAFAGAFVAFVLIPVVPVGLPIVAAAFVAVAVGLPSRGSDRGQLAEAGDA
ncbi:MAG: AzlC family protein [Frankiales bacterium]|nr:AzlC family protein [Frankiales bacterium]